MGEGETELEMVQRHVREGRARVERQGELVARLRTKGEPVDIAESLLSQFRASQQQHEAHLAQLDDKQGAAPDGV